MADKNIEKILRPESVAVIGASSKTNSVGFAVFSNIMKSGFQGIVYPVNPKAKSVLSVRTYPSVTAIDDTVDLAVIITPRESVPAVLEECGKKGIHGAVIITAGFKEIGGEGIELQKKVIDMAKKYDISLVGPNCLGVINASPSVSLNASFAGTIPKTGNVAFISQSGAVGVAALDYAQKEDFGFSKFVSIGNKADLNECDILEFLKDDAETKVILMYVEDLEDPKRFLELAQDITTQYGKPIIAIKSGRSAEGQKAASSHTGALSGSDEMYDSLFMQAGVVRVNTLEQLFELAVAFANQPLPKTNQIAIITNAGGPGIMTTDACVRYNLQLAQFSESTEKELKEKLPITANIHNPVDVIGDAGADRYEAALHAVLKDEGVGGVIVICTPQLMTKLEDVAQTVVTATKNYAKPVMCCFMSLTGTEKLDKIFDEANIPNYAFPESCARALGMLALYSRWVRRPKTEIKVFKDVDKQKAAAIIKKAQNEKRIFLTELEAYEVLEAYKFPVPVRREVKNYDEASKAANEIGYPVVLKIISPDILHKVDAGGVRINIKNEEELKANYEGLLSDVKAKKPDARIIGVNVVEHISGGVETILGMNRDKLFGPLLMFGLGGIYVEVFKDVTFRIAPIRELGAHRMIEQVKGYKILKGARGKPECDIDFVAECIERLSQLVMDFPDIAELDVNPLKIFAKGNRAKIVDARILLT